VVHQKRTEDEAALAAFLHALEVNPRNAEACRWAAVVYADRGDLANEHRMARAAYESQPEDPAYAIPFARVLMNRMGAYEEALTIETKVLAAGHATPALLEDIGHLHGVLDHGGESERFYRRAIELAPRDALAMRGLCWALKVQDRNDEAIEACRRAVAL